LKVLVTGVLGQLGSEVIKLLNGDAIGVDKDEIDLSDDSPVPGIYDGVDAVIHCAAYTAVDKAESDAALAEAINAGGARKLAEFARRNEAKFLYISTDYVFDGTKNGVYLPEDKPNPQSVYGRTKLGGEVAVREILTDYFIVRTSWVFGNAPSGSGNFVKTMLRLAETKPEISVVNDQIGSPTYAADLAKLLVEMIKTDKYGIYHATNEGFCSWYDFACAILGGKNVKINPIPTSEYPTPAKRPQNSRLSKQKLMDNGFASLPTWQDALKRYRETL
jgi:dTDP-4-dehydrorhamnose reductase